MPRRARAIVNAMKPKTAKKKSTRTSKEDLPGPDVHGLRELPGLTVEGYSLQLRDKDGFVGDQASQTAFRELLERWRKRSRKNNGKDPLGGQHSRDLSKRELDLALQEKKEFDAGYVMHATGAILEDLGVHVQLGRLSHNVDDGGLIGWVHLAPREMLKGHDAILAVDIGGTNVRCGIVKTRHRKARDFSLAKVVRREKWRHADDEPNRSNMVEHIADMLEDMVRYSERKKIRLAPFIGIGCPGLIRPDGSIARGAQNLPGDWESHAFHLPSALWRRMPMIGSGPTLVLMHNDAVVQGLSELPFMRDVQHWGVLTIGTGLGNASFTNRR
jgi:hypothetical protein